VGDKENAVNHPTRQQKENTLLWREDSSSSRGVTRVMGGGIIVGSKLNQERIHNVY